MLGKLLDGKPGKHDSRPVEQHAAKAAVEPAEMVLRGELCYQRHVSFRHRKQSREHAIIPT